MWGHVARAGEIINAYRISMGKTEAKIHLGKLGIEGKIMLRIHLRRAETSGRLLPIW